MRVVELTCSNCGKGFTRRKAEHDRNLRRGRTAAYCSNSCVIRGKPGDGIGSIPWLRPRTEQEKWLAEMIAGAAIEYRKTFNGEDLAGTQATQDYWSGYWSALIDYGRRVFRVQAYNGPEVHDDSAR